MGLKAKRWLLLLLAVPFLLSGQQPQTQTAPIYAVNAKYLQGTSAGYRPTAGAGLTLNLAAGRARCGNPMMNYAGGTLTMANNTTNYVFLDPGSSCAPGSNTTGYTSALIGVATVVTSGGAITSITDDRTLGMDNKTGGAPGTGTVTSIATTSPITGGTITNTGTIACPTCTVTVASGTSALGTSAIGSGACATAVTTSASGVATTDNIMADFNADPTSTTGYSASASGMLTIIKYPTANNVNFKVCNNTSASITPGAATLNWRVVR
jgi:hypothetical protein